MYLNSDLDRFLSLSEKVEKIFFGIDENNLFE